MDTPILDNQWLSIFPEMIGYVKKQNREYKKTLKDKMDSLVNVEVDIALSKFANVDYIKYKITQYKLNKEIDLLNKKIRKNKRMLDYVNNATNNDTITPVDIENARNVPIDSIIEVNRGVALCPFHKEKTPSFHIYEKDNKYHCFGCAAHGDVISLYMKLNNLNFIDAVKGLNGL